MNAGSIPNWVWIAVGGLLLTVSPLIFWLPRYTTSSPSYCLSCHDGSGGLPNRGIESKVHPSFTEVTCTGCHAKPGQIVYEGYREGFTSEPERVSPNCVKCHRKIGERNDQVGFKFNPLQIVIPHRVHLDLGAKCTDCHANVAHDLREPQTNRPRMEYCSQCHATTTESCGKCHADEIPAGALPPPFPAGLVGDGRGLYSRYCANCHGAKGDRVAGVDLQSRKFLDIRSFDTLRIIIAEGHGGMPSFGELWGGPLTDDEIRAIVAYLKLSSEGFAANGSSLYESNCVVCHGAQGDKMPTVDLSSAEFSEGLGREEVSRAIREGKGGMPAFSKPAGGPLAWEEIEAIARYAASLSAPAKPELDVAALYSDNCAVCHGKDGSQIPSGDLGSAEFWSSRSDEELFAATAEGKGGMPAFSATAGGDLSNEEIAAILEFLKSKAGLGPPAPAPVPPEIPHGLEGMTECLKCHGPEGIKPVPADHAGRTADSCQVCHHAAE